jgi:hypothetical protein
LEEFAQPFRGKRDGIRPRDPDDVEALRPRGIAERGVQRRRGQKSRLA